MNPSAEPRSGSSRFVTTQWNVVLNAAGPGGAQSDALEQLCRAYWYPIYAFIRRRGNGPDDAQDLTQEFFARLLQKGWLSGIEPTGGRFRSFLLTAVNRFLANEFDRAQAAKRGGGKRVISLDDERAEQRYANEPFTEETPEKVFERRWASTLMDQALTRLRDETTAAGTSRQFAALNLFLSREPGSGEYASVALELESTSAAVAVAVHRLRARYRDLVRQEVARTLTDPADINAEMRHLYEALSS